MIFLSCKEDLYAYNAYHLVKAFFPEEEVHQTVDQGLGETLHMKFPDGQILTVEECELSGIEDRKQRKYMVDVKLYKAGTGLGYPDRGAPYKACHAEAGGRHG